MLKKLSKCEVKASLITQILRNIKFGHNYMVKKCKFEQFFNSNFPISKFRVSKIGKNETFGLFEIAEIGFYVKSVYR